MIKCARNIARSFNQPKIYDSLYAALAELRGCEFWTADKTFYDAVKSTLSFVRYLPDYLLWINVNLVTMWGNIKYLEDE